MRIRRRLLIPLIVLLIIAAVAMIVTLRKNAPPEAARLLPGADAFFYLDLSKARKANSGNALPAVSHDPEYESFIRETGFQFERDLDEAAFAAHYPATWPGGGTAGSDHEMRFSEVLVGKFDLERLTNYLRQIAQSVENYRSIDIFKILVDGRSVRVAVLSPDSVAVSNLSDPAVIRGIIDRSRRLASPFGGPSLLRQYYKNVQFASLLWLVARIDPTAPQSSAWSTLLSKPATVVVSGSALSPLHLRPDAVHLRAEAFTQNSEDARTIVDKANVLAALTRSAENSVGSRGTDSDVKAVFDSLQVKQDGDRAVVTASMPIGFLRKMLTGASTDSNESGSAPAMQSPAVETPAKSR